MAKAKKIKKKKSVKSAGKKSLPKKAAKKKSASKKKSKPKVPPRLLKLRKKRASLYSQRRRIQKAIMGAESKKEVLVLSKSIKKVQKELNGVRHKIKVVNFRKTKKAKKLISQRSYAYTKKKNLLKARKKAKTKKERRKINRQLLSIQREILEINRKLQLKKKPKKREQPPPDIDKGWLVQRVPVWVGEEMYREATRKKVFKRFIIEDKEFTRRYVSTMDYHFQKMIDRAYSETGSSTPEMVVSKNYKYKIIGFKINF